MFWCTTRHDDGRFPSFLPSVALPFLLDLFLRCHRRSTSEALTPSLYISDHDMSTCICCCSFTCCFELPFFGPCFKTCFWRCCQDDRLQEATSSPDNDPTIEMVQATDYRRATVEVGAMGSNAVVVATNSGGTLPYAYPVQTGVRASSSRGGPPPSSSSSNDGSSRQAAAYSSPAATTKASSNGSVVDGAADGDGGSPPPLTRKKRGVSFAPTNYDTRRIPVHFDPVAEASPRSVYKRRSSFIQSSSVGDGGETMSLNSPPASPRSRHPPQGGTGVRGTVAGSNEDLL